MSFRISRYAVRFLVLVPILDLGRGAQETPERSHQDSKDYERTRKRKT